MLSISAKFAEKILIYRILFKNSSRVWFQNFELLGV